MQIINMILLCQTQSNGIDWFKIIEMLIPVLVAILAFWFGLRRLKKETSILVQRKKLDTTIESYQECWKLLRYMTPTENRDSILRFEKNKNETQWFARLENGQLFLDELTAVFYEKGYGLFYSKDIKEKLFEYRSILYGLLLKEKGKQEVQLTNENMINRMSQLYDELNNILKEKLSETAN
ncbi:MAG: hypothetical protein H6607_06090 [Flavobacteriales bacterium]|nr:hypothetical protein [Flavobacteriales bacterium]